MIRITNLLLAIACLLSFCRRGAGAATAVEPRFAPPPRLATTPAELADGQREPNFAAVRTTAVAAADELLLHPVVLPQGYGGWVFYYACPEDGTALHALSPAEHQCPRCLKVYRDERTVAAYRYTLHAAAEQAAETFGWAFAYTHDPRCAEGAKRILLHLARAYPNYPLRLDHWGHTGAEASLGGRRYVQSLDEAVGIVRLSKAYDLTRTSAAWSAAERDLVERDLFKLTAATLLQFNQDINNHQTWYNAGLMAIASVLGDAALVRKVLDTRGGFRDQLSRSVAPDGLWYEGTMAYHSYALQAMTAIVEAGRRLGLPLQDEPKFRAMFTGPLHAAYPNGQFPAVNDSDPFDLSGFTSAFEWAWRTWQDPLFAQAAAHGDAARLAALLGHPAAVQWPLQLHSEAGTALVGLRQGTGAGTTCAFVHYGPHGGGHGHFDKLGLMLFANGREWLLDPGRLTYSHKEYKTWVKETAAHNTVTRGGETQQATTGKLLFLHETPAFAACATQSDEAYEATRLRRYLLLTRNFLLDVYQVEGRQQLQTDWFAHAVVDAIKPVGARPPGEPVALGTDHGYQHLTEARAWAGNGTSRWDFLPEPAPSKSPFLRLWLAGAEPEQIITASGIGYTIDQKAPCLIRRHVATRTSYVAAYDLSGKGNYIRDLQVMSDSPTRLILTTQERNWKVAFQPTEVVVQLTS